MRPVYINATFVIVEQNLQKMAGTDDECEIAFAYREYSGLAILCQHASIRTYKKRDGADLLCFWQKLDVILFFGLIETHA